MNQEQIEELAVLDALGALDGTDVAVWQEVCAGDASAGQLRDELAEVAVQLAFSGAGVKAPAALKGRVMGAVFGSDPRSEPATSPAADRRTFRISTWAAAAAVSLLALTGASMTTRQKESVVVRDVRPEPHDLFIPLEGYGDYAGVKGSVLWDSGQRGWYVQAAGLPELPATHRYRVWAVGAEGEVHDCGEMPLRGGGLARRFVQPGDDINSMQGFAVSIEPAGGQPSAPTSPAVLISAGLKS